MLTVMAKKPEKLTNQDRKRVARSHRWLPELLEALDRYRESQDVPPSEIAVLEKALTDFLRSRGFIEG